MKIFNKLFFLLLVCLFLLGVSSAYAQEVQPESARYRVQSGDTMSAIAVRFGIGLQELQNFNNVADPNQISAGDVLTLPGVDWISGLIVGQSMPLGETLTSLSLKYRISREDFAKLNRVSTTSQLHVSFPLLVPTERGENVSMGRAVVAPLSSVMEIAIVSGGNPWAIVEANQLLGSWAALPSQILYLPAVIQNGPGGLPSPISSLEVGATGIVQGRAFSLIANAQDRMNRLEGRLLGKDFVFIPFDGTNLISLLGIHALADPGFYPLTISGETAHGVPFTFTQVVKVADGSYTFERVSVDLPDQTIAIEEINRIIDIVSLATPEKMWQGLFQLPTPFGEINSYFGTRRSYNGSPYDYYHGGIDYGGGMGTQIFAPAIGEVVFAGPLDIRGNATIINHGWGVYTGYYHQDQILVNVGDKVETGQVIGLVGNSGNSTGAHLHWEVWVAGVQVEPFDWLYILFP